MTRHSKNNTSSSIFTYHERKKIKDFNSLKQRLGSSSMRKFEQCWLCLSFAIKPVTTPLGYIFCRECIITNLSKQLEDNKKKIRRWELDIEQHKATLKEKEKLEFEERKRKFLDDNLYGSVLDKRIKTTGPSNTFKEDNKEVANSFWTGSNPGSKPQKKEEDADNILLPRPKNILTCPISGKPLKVKDLVDLNPESIRGSEENNSTVWICSVSKKPISHNLACVIKKSGKIVLKKFLGGGEDSERDLYVPLIPGGTGFSSHNSVEATKFRPSMQ
ncbi:hypothetical protein BEWA_005360 [Theileria equi strain WA]|uniref:Nitric oxide synthase-interacting protein zinc-finger domain-containing protein n=1 Tax=Theileria equi strain WA TaxID=1537102 RepID=L0B0T6_THEEQ|nr:hypothetical protein BEWA_005360 [Theileria equi strain WA]AFZ81128.1 hypothetical protein BEWA_005360 [Theileria equi strain WA]|eukprot:XP_004830794.1 hypothetical protein BEWA_005360 [Theileria equi strain WA]